MKNKVAISGNLKLPNGIFSKTIYHFWVTTNQSELL